METQTVEHNILIAERVKGKGDTWILIGEDVEHPSLTETLEAYFQKTGNNVHFRLEPLNSKLFAISKQEEEVVIEPPKRFNIYGDFD
jgi:hypothetical protein|tara:strand:+ start:63 stop:323 length:261 start_codon:yes stop_codon:yes gene_type:complete